MKTIIRNLIAGVTVVAIAVALILALNIAGPGFSTAALTALLAPTKTPKPPVGDVIPMQSISELDSFDATVKLDVNGLIDGERTQGDLTGKLSTNPKNKSRITVSGSLLGELAAKVGGSLVGLFTPSKVDLYNMPDGAYIVVNGLLPVCIKPEALNATESLDDLNPQSLLTMLTSSDVARGELVGEETLNGETVQHYVIDGDSFLIAAQNSKDEKLRTFGESLWSAEDAHVYVDAETGYPVAFRGRYSGSFEPLKFDGDFGIELDLTSVPSSSKVALPSACKRPISK